MFGLDRADQASGREERLLTSIVPYSPHCFILPSMRKQADHPFDQLPHVSTWKRLWVNAVKPDGDPKTSKEALCLSLFRFTLMLSD